MKYIFLLILFFVCAIGSEIYGQISRPQAEDDYYIIKTLPIPEDVKLEVGGLAVLDDGRLAVSTRRGEIWMVDNPYMLSGQPHYSLYASGMHEMLGLAYKDGSFYGTQRGELTKLTDTDNDGRADRYEKIAKFDLSGNYHEYAYGPVFDKNGDMFVTLNVAWIGYGEGLSKWHGWLLKIKPDGALKPIATGLRSPAGFMINTHNDLLYAENQGDWVGSGRVTHLEEGDFAGNAGGLNWTQEPESPLKLTKVQLAEVDDGRPMHEAAKVIKEMKLPAVWFPHALMGISTSDIQEDTTGGAFGPFGGQYFVADQGHSKIMRMTLEKVDGEYQGACYPFKEGFASGLLRLRWGLDGSLFAGMTSRGWASTGREDYALQRLVWTGKTPFEMKNIAATPDGFEIEFTMPVEKRLLQDPTNYEISGFTYHYHHEYGSEIINNVKHELKGIQVGEDGKSVRLVMKDSLREGYIHEIKVHNMVAKNGTNLLHNYAYYTLNKIPAGERAVLKEGEKVASSSAHNHHAIAAPQKDSKEKVSTAVASKTPSPEKLAKRQLEKPASWAKVDQVLVIGTKPGLKYDISSFEVKAGSNVKLVFNNNDDMQHNVVIVLPNTANDVGEMALNMGLEGSQKDYVPDTPKVLFHTKILQPNGSETIYFKAPDKPGEYTFVCTYPGHYSIMRGVMKVTK